MYFTTQIHVRFTYISHIFCPQITHNLSVKCGNFQETSKLRAGGHSLGNGNLAALSSGNGSRPTHHGGRGKVERKIPTSPADNTRVPYSHNYHHHYQRHTGHPRMLQHNPSQYPPEEKDPRSYHHKQSTVRIVHLILLLNDIMNAVIWFCAAYLINGCMLHAPLCVTWLPHTNVWYNIVVCAGTSA